MMNATSTKQFGGHLTGFELRPLSLGEILDRAFLMYRRHIILFLGITAIPQVLTILLGLFQIFLGPLNTVRTIGDRTVLMPNFDVTSLLVLLLGVVLGLIVYALAQGGTILAVSDLYLGRPANIADSLSRAAGEIWALLGTTLLNGLAVFGATLALVIPGIYVACRLIVCLPAAVIENRSPGEALSRSWNLTKGYAGRSFVLLLLYFAVAFGVGLLIGLPLSFLTDERGASGNVRLLLGFRQLSSVIVNILVQPLLLIGTSIFYFDLRVRKEAFDLQFLMDPNSERTARGDGSVPSIIG